MQSVGRKSAKKVLFGYEEELGASKDTTHHQIKSLGKLYRSCISVTHKLTPQQTQCRVNIYHQLIDLSGDRIIRIIDLSGELSYVMKNQSISATLMPQNSGSVPVNLPESSLKKINSAPK